MTHACKLSKSEVAWFKRQSGNKRTDGRTRPIALSSPLNAVASQDGRIADGSEVYGSRATFLFVEEPASIHQLTSSVVSSAVSATLEGSHRLHRPPRLHRHEKATCCWRRRTWSVRASVCLSACHARLLAPVKLIQIPWECELGRAGGPRNHVLDGWVLLSGHTKTSYSSQSDGAEGAVGGDAACSPPLPCLTRRRQNQSVIVWFQLALLDPAF